jgi:hypothetical protein
MKIMNRLTGTEISEQHQIPFNEIEVIVAFLRVRRHAKIADTVFDDIQPRQCRYVRLTITDWPKESELGIIEATVFGKYSGYINPTNPQENDRYLYKY